MTSQNLSNATSLPVSADGPSPSRLPESQMTFHFGLEAAPASPSPLAESSLATRTSAISGPPSSGSSKSAALQSFLANRLRARLPFFGWTEYSMIWKDRATPAGRVICALRASAPRTSDNDCIGLPEETAGWTSPISSEARQGFQDRTRGKKGTQESLTTQAIKNFRERERESCAAGQPRAVETGRIQRA